MGYVLSLETSSPQGSLALIDDTTYELIDSTLWLKGPSHSELATAKLADWFKSKYTLDELSGLFLGNGPGSFTGIRVALSIAKTLAYSLALPIYSTSSLRILAEPELDKKAPVICLVNAFKNMIYFAGYQRRDHLTKELFPPQALRPEMALKLIPAGAILVGDGWHKYLDQWPEKLKGEILVSTLVYPEARFASPLLSPKDGAIDQTSWQDLKPLYIRASEAEEKLREKSQ